MTILSGHELKAQPSGLGGEEKESVMEILIHKTVSVALAVGVIALLAPTSNAANAATHPDTAKHNAKHSAGKINHRGAQASSSVRALTTDDATVYSAPPGTDTLPLAQAQQQAQESVYDEEAGQKALADGILNTAEVDFRHSVDLNRSNPNALAGLAQTLEREGKNRQAIHVYRYLLYPKQGWGTSLEEDPILRLHFALLLTGDGQWPEAVSVYESTIGGISLGPSFPDVRVHFSPSVPQPVALQAMAHLAMGITYTNQLEHAQALPEYAAALSMQPNLAVASYYYGRGLTRLERRAEAKAAFERAAAHGEDDVKKAAGEALTGFK